MSDFYIILSDQLERVGDLDPGKVIDPLTIEDADKGEHTLTFRYPLEDESDVVEGGQIILIKDADDDFQPFRVIESKTTVSNINTQQVKCEHLFYELANGKPQNYAVSNFSATQAIAMAVDGVRWQVGNIDESITDLKELSGSYNNPLRILRDIEETYTARLKFRATVGKTKITGLYVDLLEIDYEFSGKRFEFGHDLKDVDITIDHSRVYTALTGIVEGAETDPVTEEAIPLTFASAVWSTGDGDPADKPLGQTWVGSEEARELYGIYNPDTGLMEHRHGVYDGSAATTAETLLSATWLIGTRYHFSPKTNIEASVADLSAVRIVDVTSGEVVTLDDDKLRVGNICYVIAREHGLLAQVDVRIIRIERYLKEPERTVVILGDALFAGSDYFKELEEEIDSKTRRRAQAPDRGPGATVTIASEDTSNYPEYADIIVPAGVAFDSYFNEAMGRISTVDGGHILILEGRYAYNDTLIINKNNVTISGQGRGTLLKLADDRPAPTHGLYAEGRTGVIVRDLVMDGNIENQGAHFSEGIRFEAIATHEHTWGWPDAFSKSWYTTDELTEQNMTMGWRFKVDRPTAINSIRTRLPVDRTYTVHVWDATDQSQLFSTTITNNSAQFNTKWLDEEYSLVPDREYRIAFDYTYNEDWGWRALDPDEDSAGNDTVVEDEEFADEVTMIEACVSFDGHGTYPGYNINNFIPGYVDFGLSPETEGNEQMKVNNISVKGYSRSGIYVDGGRNVEIANCRCNENDSGIWVAAMGSRNDDIRILGCEASDNEQGGILLWNAWDSMIEHCIAIGNVATGLNLFELYDCAIVGNMCKQGGDIEGFNLAGISILDCSRNTVIGNVSNGNRFWGISLEGGGENVVTSNSCNNSEEASGILLWDGTVRNTIQANKCRGNDLYGIRIGSGATHNQVTNNDLEGNTLGGILDNGTGTVTTAGNRT